MVSHAKILHFFWGKGLPDLTIAFISDSPEVHTLVAGFNPKALARV
jgi:hypothetical protein